MATIDIKYFSAVPRFERLKAEDPKGGFDLYWEAHVQGFQPLFNVEYSETETGPWIPVLDQPEDVTFILSVTPKILTTQILRFFRLVVYAASAPTVRVFESAVQYNSNNPDRAIFLQWREQLRRKRLQLRHRYAGIPSMLLSRRVFGQVCAQCVDKVLGSTVSSTCTECYGTGFIGGYHLSKDLMADYAQTRTAPPNEKIEGNTDAETRSVVTLPFPLARFKDIWVDVNNIRWRVEKNDVTDFRALPLVQNITLTKFPASDIAYEVPIPIRP